MSKAANCIKVFLCDDHTLFRQGIRKLIDLERDIKIVGEANNGLELIEMLQKTQPDVILMDIEMPEMDGVAATCKIKKMLPHSKIIILTVYEDDTHIFESIKVGALGYLLKDVTIDELLGAIRQVYEGEAIIQPSIAAKVLKEFAVLDRRKKEHSLNSYNDLTERQKEVLRLVSQGETNRNIAKKLGIAEKTVKNHISSIFQTLHVNNRTQATISFLEKQNS